MRSLHHSFDIDLASKYGIEEAILIHHFQYWICYNQKLKRNFIDNCTWTYQTREEIAAYFPYLNAVKVKYHINNLIRNGIIKTSNHNQSPIDKTLWYAFVNEKMFTKDNMVQSRDEIVPSIPDTITTNTETNKDVSLSTKDKQNNKRDPSFFVCPSEKEKKKAEPKEMDEKQKEVFEWLKKQQIDSTEETFKTWALNYSISHITEAVAFAKSKNPRSLGKYINTILSRKLGKLSSRAHDNRCFAANFLKKNPKSGIILKSNHCLYMNGRSKEDISYEMNTNDFIQLLEKSKLA